MIDIAQFITDHANEDLNHLINAIYNTTDGTGEAKTYNEAVLGKDVKDSIVKLALLIREMIGKIGGKTESDADRAESAATSAEDILDQIHDIIVTTSPQTVTGWRNGRVATNGIIEYDATNSMISAPIDHDPDVLSVEYTGAEYSEGRPYFVHLSQFRAGTPGQSTFIRRDTMLFDPTGVHSAINFDVDCASYIYTIGFEASTGEIVTEDTPNDFSAVAYIYRTAVLTKEVNDLTDQLYGPLTEVPAFEFTNGNVITETFITSDNRTVYAGELRGSTYYARNITPISVSGHKFMRYTACVTGGGADLYHYGIAFYDAGLYDGDTIDDPASHFVKGVKAHFSDATTYEWRTVAIPDNAAYVMICYWVNPANMNSPAFKMYFADRYEYGDLYEAEQSSGETAPEWLKDEANRIGLHTVPDTMSHLNIVKRCRQMTDIKWTPAVDLPRFEYVTQTPPYATSKQKLVRNIFKAGVEYTGLPYTKCKDTLESPYVYEHENYDKDDFYVGYGVSFETFITAIKNEDSLLCEKGIEILNDPSKNAAALEAHVGTIYGIVCSALASYALNLPSPKTATLIGLLPSLIKQTNGSTGKLLDWWDGTNLADNFMPGDILNYSGFHSAIVTDIVHDASGKIIIVEVSEATTVGNGNEDVMGGPDGGIVRRKGFSPKDLIDRFGENYVVLRYVADNIPYTIEPFARVQGEPDGFRLNELPIMPYEGSGFVYKRSWIAENPVRLLISTSGYNTILIYGDDPATPVDVIDGENFDPTAEYIDYDASGLANGKYGVCLALYNNAVEDHRTAIGWFSIVN